MWLTEFFANIFVRHRWFVILVVLVCSVLSAIGMAGQSYQRRLGEGSAGNRNRADRNLLSEVGQQFDLESIECLVVIDGEDVLAKPNVLALREIQEALRALPQVATVFWVDDIPTMNLFGLAEPLLPEDSASIEAFLHARERVLANPLAIGQLVSPDATTAMMPLSYDWYGFRDKSDVTASLITRTEEVLAKHPDANLRVRLTGRVPILQAIEQNFNSNQSKFQFISYALVFFLAVFLFRGWRAVVVVGSAPAMGIFWTMGLLDFFHFERNGLTSIVMPVLVSMVGMTDGIHMMLHIRRNRAGGATPEAAVHDAIVRVGPACALTSITTAIGFASLLLTKTEFIRNFGQGCMWAVVICFVAVVTVIPLLCCTWLGRDIHHSHDRDIVGKSLERFQGLMDFVIRRSSWITAGAVVLTLAFGALALTLHPDANTHENLPASSSATKTLRHCDKAFGGIEFARILVEWPAELPETSPQILQAVQRVEQIVDSETLLRHPFSIRNLTQALAPDDANLGEQMSLLTVVPPPILRTVHNVDERRTLINMRTQDLGVATYQPVFHRVQQQLDQLATEFPGFRFAVTGLPVVEGREISQIVYDLAASLGTASVVIFVVMSIAYRSIRIGLISIIPNALPLLVTASLLVVTGTPLSFTSVCAFVVCVGIAVDDTIHFLTRFLQEKELETSTSVAIKKSFRAVGAALITTTLVLVTGFASVLISELPSHRTFSLMACSTIITALIADLVILPAMLASFYRQR
ncbi:MAG: MMPL family transporter [Planctomycetales bacterium]|nr:MMPL family transporter [Planctomycetales bacterium]